MDSGPKTFKMTVEMDVVDIPTMYEMSDAEYRRFIQGDGLFHVDHHDILRSDPAGYPLATTLEQFDILIEELQGLRGKMVSRADK